MAFLERKRVICFCLEMHCDPWSWPFLGGGGHWPVCMQEYFWNLNTIIGEKIQRRAPRVFLDKESHKYYPTTIETGMAKICPFSIAYNYHVSSVVGFQNFLQAFCPFKVLVPLLYLSKIQGLEESWNSLFETLKGGWNIKKTLKEGWKIKNATSLLEMSFM